MKCVSTTAELRKYADSRVAADPLLQRKRTEALLHFLRTVEVLHSLESLELGTAGLYLGLRERQDILRFAVYKIFEHCPKDATRPLTTSSDMLFIQETLATFRDFSIIQDLIVGAETGYFRVSIDERAHAINFEWSNERIARGFDAVLEAGTPREAELQQRYQGARQPAASHINELLGTIVLDQRRSLFSYNVPDNILAEFISTAVDIEDRPEIPLEWSAGAYTFGEFHKFWSVLKAISVIHGLVLAAAVVRARNAGWSAPPLNGATIPLSDNYLEKLVRKHVGIPVSVTRQIVRDLTYAPLNVPHVDVVYQPLLPVEAGHFLSTATLLGGSSHERNFLALVDRIPWRQLAAQGLKDGREAFMLEQIQPLCVQMGFANKAKLRLGSPNEPVGDIDLLVWTSDSSLAIAFSLKWLNGPDSVREVASHDSRHRDGVTRHRIHLAYLRMHAEQISRDFNLLPALKANTDFQSAVVTKVARPSLAVEHEEIPIVTLDELLDALERCRGDLALLFRILESASTTAEKLSDAVMEPLTFTFGEYSVTAPSRRMNLE